MSRHLHVIRHHTEKHPKQHVTHHSATAKSHRSSAHHVHQHIKSVIQQTTIAPPTLITAPQPTSPQMAGSGSIPNLYFRGTIVAPPVWSFSGYICTVLRTGQTVPETGFISNNPGYVPRQGDIVECQARDGNTNYIVWPIGTSTVTPGVGAPGNPSYGVTSGRYIGVVPDGGPTGGTWSAGDYGMDTNGWLWYCVSSGTPGTWRSPAPRGELGYTESDVNTDVTANNTVDVISVTISTDGTRKVKLTAYGIVNSSTAGSNNFIFIREGTTVLQEGLWQSPASNYYETMSVSKRLVPTAGQHTYKLTISTNAGTMTINGSSAGGYSAYIEAEDRGSV